jgi:hypothetical protein
MTTHEEIYEPPVLVEVGDFTELTLGAGPADCYDAFWGDAWFC